MKQLVINCVMLYCCTWKAVKCCCYCCVTATDEFVQEALGHITEGICRPLKVVVHCCLWWFHSYIWDYSVICIIWFGCCHPVRVLHWCRNIFWDLKLITNKSCKSKTSWCLNNLLKRLNVEVKALCDVYLLTDQPCSKLWFKSYYCIPRL